MLEEACDPRRWRWSSTTCKSAPGRSRTARRRVTRRAGGMCSTPRVLVGADGVHAPRHDATRLMGAAQLRTWKAWQLRESATDVGPRCRPAPSTSRPRLNLRRSADEAVLRQGDDVGLRGTPWTSSCANCGVIVVAVVGVALEVGIEPMFCEPRRRTRRPPDRRDRRLWRGEVGAGGACSRRCLRGDAILPTTAT